jgi:hypothetical protein
METRYVFSPPVSASVNTSSTLPLSLQKDEVYLNLVLEYVPETVYRASRHYAKLKQVMPMLQVKLYMYQVSLGSRDRIQ